MLWEIDIPIDQAIRREKGRYAGGLDKVPNEQMICWTRFEGFNDYS